MTGPHTADRAAPLPATSFAAAAKKPPGALCDRRSPPMPPHLPPCKRRFPSAAGVAAAGTAGQRGCRMRGPPPTAADAAAREL